MFERVFGELAWSLGSGPGYTEDSLYRERERERVYLTLFTECHLFSSREGWIDPARERGGRSGSWGRERSDSGS